MKVKALKNFMLYEMIRREGEEFEIEDSRGRRLIQDGFVSECNDKSAIKLEESNGTEDKEILEAEKPKKKGKKTKKDA